MPRSSRSGCSPCSRREPSTTLLAPNARHGHGKECQIACLNAACRCSRGRRHRPQAFAGHWPRVLGKRPDPGHSRKRSVRVRPARGGFRPPWPPSLEEWQVQPARQSAGTRQGRGWGVLFSFNCALNDSSFLVSMRVAYEHLVFLWLILLRHVPQILTQRELFNQDKGERGDL